MKLKNNKNLIKEQRKNSQKSKNKKQIWKKNNISIKLKTQKTFLKGPRMKISNKKHKCWN